MHCAETGTEHGARSSGTPTKESKQTMAGAALCPLHQCAREWLPNISRVLSVFLWIIEFILHCEFYRTTTHTTPRKHYISTTTNRSRNFIEKYFMWAASSAPHRPLVSASVWACSDGLRARRPNHFSKASRDAVCCRSSERAHTLTHTLAQTHHPFNINYKFGEVVLVCILLRCARFHLKILFVCVCRYAVARLLQIGKLRFYFDCMCAENKHDLRVFHLHTKTS